MGNGYGQRSIIGLVFQNSYGTAGSVNSLHYIPFISEDFAVEKPPLYSTAIRGIFDEGDTYEGPNMCGGTLNAEAQAVPLGAILKSMLNEDSVVNSGALYTRTFRPRTSDFDGYSANNPVTIYAYRDVGSAMLYSDMNCSKLDLNIANGEFLTVAATYVGGTFSQDSATAASLPTGKRWTWNVASVSLGGSASANIGDMKISIDDGALTAQHTINGSVFPSRIKRTGWRTIAVTGTFKFDDQNEYQEFISQSERELIMHLEGVTAVQSGYNESLTIRLPLMRYEEAKPAAGGPGPIEMAVTARGKYSVTSATALEIVLANDQATY